MSSKMPPVPPAGRSDKGPGEPSAPNRETSPKTGKHVPENLSEQDQQANTKQNTTNQGYQQDR